MTMHQADSDKALAALDALQRQIKLAASHIVSAAQFNGKELESSYRRQATTALDKCEEQLRIAREAVDH